MALQIPQCINSSHIVHKINSRLERDVIKPAEYIVPLASSSQANLYCAQWQRTIVIVKADQISEMLLM